MSVHDLLRDCSLFEDLTDLLTWIQTGEDAAAAELLHEVAAHLAGKGWRPSVVLDLSGSELRIGLVPADRPVAPEEPLVAPP